MIVTMKTILILTLVACTAVTPLSAASDKPEKKDKSEKAEKGDKEKKSKKDDEASEEKKVPPGLMKKEGLPPGQIKKGKHPTRPEKVERVPADLTITNEPLSSVTTTSAPPVRPDPDDRRVESPRGAEILPIPSTNAPAASDKSVEAQAPARPLTPREKLEQERELNALLLKVILSRSNTRERTETLRRMADETGTPAASIAAQSKVNPALSGGDLLMGNKIASLSGKPAVDVFNAHARDNQWLATGESFGVQPSALMDAAKRFVESSR